MSWLSPWTVGIFPHVPHCKDMISAENWHKNIGPDPDASFLILAYGFVNIAS